MQNTKNVELRRSDANAVIRESQSIAPTVNDDPVYLETYRRQFYKTSLCKYFSEGRCFKGAACEHAHCAEELVAKPILTKSRMCKDILKKGRCELGAACPYAHDPHEMLKSNSFYKSKMCEFYFKDGGCKVGSVCRFAHSPEELIDDRVLMRQPSIDFDDCPDTGYPLKRGSSMASTRGSMASLAFVYPEVLVVRDPLSEVYYD